MGKRRSIESKTRFIRTKTRKSSGKNSVGAYNNDTTRPNLVESLPNDVIAEIVSRVAASSLTDLFRCKLSCKAFEQIGKEKYVIRQVDMEDFDFWGLGCNKDAAIAYSQLCADSDNPGALFQQGMKLYFRDMKVQQGMESLEKAAKLGHRTSAYALGLILLVCGGGGGDSGSERHRAMELIKACTGKGIVNCRIRLRKCVRVIRWHTKFVTQCKPIRFDKHDNCPRKCPWTGDLYLSEDHNNDALCCEACTFEFESKFFCKLFS